MNEVLDLTRYEAARTALAEAVRVDEVQAVRNIGLQMKGYAKIAKDKGLQADAATLVMRAERKLGVLIQSAKETGQLGIGRREKSNLADSADQSPNNGSDAEPFQRVTLSEAGIDKKLSMRAQKWARMGEPQFEQKLSDERNRIESEGATPINGARSVMASRSEPDHSLDFFPTPPWATRALIEDVLPRLKIMPDGLSIADPACGEGHMTGVFEEYPFGRVLGTDIHDYSHDGRSAPSWEGVLDFLGDAGADLRPDLIVTNPPFSGNGIDRTLAFAKRALHVSKLGVALFVRSQWAVEGVERYTELFGPTPPTLTAFFSERVNLCKGRWDPQGSTATAYAWLVWARVSLRQPTMWIPPNRRTLRARPDDVERFTAHPVIGIQQPAAPDTGASPAPGGAADPAEEGVRAPSADHTSVAADVDEATAVGGGEGAAAGALPVSSTSSEPLGAEAIKQIIKAGYAADPFPGLDELARRTGLTPNAVQQRAKRMELGSRDRQRSAASAFAQAQHASRKDSHAE
jgi:hypothetical protein